MTAHPSDTRRPRRAGTEPLTGGDLDAHELLLTIIEGPGAGRSLRSPGPRITLGAAADNDVILDDPAVSGYHCEVHLAGGQAIVRDVGSRNGTRVDNVSLISGHLANGSILTVGHTRLRCQVIPADPENLPEPERFGILTGRAPAMREIFHLLRCAADNDMTILLGGETGTGKGAAAESVHRASARRNGPFVAVDCGAITPSLLEAELFGHTRGAFTGAQGDRAGAFERADGGTLFLDEIGELPLEAQPSLLRALENRAIRRVGANNEIPVDVRIIAATNRSLRDEAAAERFRLDLFYRLAVLEIDVPPLRARMEDLPVLVEALVERELGRDESPDHRSLATLLTSDSTLRELGRYDWPGNVRELRNYIARCRALGKLVPLAEFGRDPITHEEQTPVPVIDVDTPWRDAKQQWTKHFEVEYLRRLLDSHNQDLKAAARAAGVGQAYLQRLLSRVGLRARTTEID